MKNPEGGSKERNRMTLQDSGDMGKMEKSSNIERSSRKDAVIAGEEEFRSCFETALKEYSIVLTEKQITQFYEFYVNLIQTNRTLNLTAVTDLEGVVYKHFLDSLLIVKAVPELLSKSYRVMDIGTGAGFPGIPLAIAFPEWKLTLNDSLQKRLGFIIEVCEKLGLTNVELVHGRAEDLGQQPKYREQYDLCVSRAVANLSTLSEYCIPFIHTHGLFIPYKSGKTRDELGNARHGIQLLGGKLRNTVEFTVGPEKAERTFPVIEKVSSTPKNFPRKAGVPAKKPL